MYITSPSVNYLASPACANMRCLIVRRHCTNASSKSCSKTKTAGMSADIALYNCARSCENDMRHTLRPVYFHLQLVCLVLKCLLSANFCGRLMYVRLICLEFCNAALFFFSEVSAWSNIYIYIYIYDVTYAYVWSTLVVRFGFICMYMNI